MTIQEASDLDTILSFFKLDKSRIDPFEAMLIDTTNKNTLESNRLNTILQLLTIRNDNLIEFANIEWKTTIPNILGARLTDKGVKFIKSGGYYAKRHRNQKNRNITNFLKDIALIGGGISATLYYTIYLMRLILCLFCS